MDFSPQRLAKLATSNVSHCMQRQAVIQLIMIQQILANTIDDQMEQLMLLMQKQGDGEIPDLLLGVFGRGDEINSLEVTKVDIVALDVDVEQLANVFLFLVAIQAAALELLPDVGQFLIHALLLQFAGARIAQVRDELDQSSHRRHDGLFVFMGWVSAGQALLPAGAIAVSGGKEGRAVHGFACHAEITSGVRDRSLEQRHTTMSLLFRGDSGALATPGR